MPIPDQKVAEEDKQSSVVCPMILVEGFLSALTNANKDGRLVIQRQGVKEIIYFTYNFE